MGEIFLNQPAEALMGIKIFSGVIPGIACLIGALILAFYPLRGKYLQDVQQKVLALHKEKKQILDENYADL
jgi:Na+/melibiose symporter-like transporter